MTFQETLLLHLRAIREHNIDDFKKTLHSGADLVCIEPNGAFMRSYDDFVCNHVEWFGSGDWSIDFEILDCVEGIDMSAVTLKFRLVEEDGIINTILSLVFQNRNGHWGLIHDQNTPIVSN